MAAKKCLICNSPFTGRRDAKTCSARCRKRLQKVRWSFYGGPIFQEREFAKSMPRQNTVVYKKTPEEERVRGWRKGMLPLFGLLVGLGFLLNIILATPATAATSSSYLNFQSRLLTNTGSVVPDGNYNIEFKIDNDISSSDGGTGACSGSCLWRETRQNSNSQGVRVVNGYMSVNLGSVTSFPAINWDQQLYLTMNIGGTGTGGSPSYDGAMSPRITLTALPYAFIAGQLAQTSGANRGTLSFAGVTNNPNLLLPDVASGTVLVSTTGVQLQGSTPGTQQTGNFNISGTGIAATALQTPMIDTATGIALGIGTNNATAINLNKDTTVAAGKTLTVTSGAVLLTGSTSGDALTVSNSTSTGNILILKDNAATVFSVADGGLVTVTNNLTVNGTISSPGAGGSSEHFGASSASAGSQSLAVGNGASAPTGLDIAIGYGATATSTGGGASAVGGGSSALGTSSTALGAQTTINASHASSIAIGSGATTSASHQLVIGGSSDYINNAYIGNGVTNSSPSAFTLQATGGSGSDITGAALNIGGGQGTGTGAGGGLNFQIAKPAGSTSSSLNSLSTVFSLSGASATAGAALFKNATDSTTAFQIQNASSRGLFTVSTSGSVLQVGNTTDGSNLTLAATGNANATIRKNMTVNGAVNANDLVEIDTSSAGTVKKSTASSSKVFGVATTTNGGTAAQDIVVYGIYQVNADTSGGTPAIGDLLVSSATTGSVTKSSGSASIGTVVGRALDVISGGKIWVSLTLEGGGSDTLQTAYTNSTAPATITTTDNKDLVFNLADTATDSSFLVNLQCATSCGANGKFAIQAASTDVLSVAPNGGNISVGVGGFANTLQIGNTTGAVAQIINIGNNSTGSSTNNVNIGSSIAGTTAVTGPTTITNRTSGSSDTFVVSNSTSTGTIAKFQDNSTTVFSLADGGAALFQNQSNSTAAFQIQNAAGSQLLNIDTSTTPNLLTSNPDFEATSVSSWVGKLGTETVARTTSASYQGNASLSVTEPASAATNSGVKYVQALSATTTYALSAYVKLQTSSISTFEIGRSENGAADTSCLTGQTVTAGAWTRLTCTFTTGDAAPASSYIYIRDTAGNINKVWYVDAVQLEAKTNLLSNPGVESAISASDWNNPLTSTNTPVRSTTAGHFNSGVAGLDVTPTTTGTNRGVKVPVTLSSYTTYSFYISVKDPAPTTTSLEIGRSEDGSAFISCATSLITASGSFTQYSCTFTTGATSGSTFIYVRDATSRTNAQPFYIDSAQLFAGTNTSASAFQNSTIALNGVINSPTAFRNQVDSTTAFQLQNSVGTSILSVDTTNGRIAVDANYSAMSTPTGLSVGAPTSGGLLTASSTYRYKVTAIDSAGGETAASTEANNATTANRTLPVTWTAVTGASGYKVYRTAAGGAANTEVYLASVLTNSYTDTAADIGGTATPPSIGTAYTSTNNSNSTLQLSVGGLGTPTGQVYISGIAPTFIGQLGSATAANGINSPSNIAISGNYAYIAQGNGTGRLTIVDISNPYSLQMISNVRSGNDGKTRVVVSGNYAYVIGNWGGGTFEIYNISNPSMGASSGSTASVQAPVGSTQTGLGDFVMDLAVSGRYAYVTDYTNGAIVVFDVSNPANPTVVNKLSGSAAGITSTGALYASGNILYMKNSYGNLATYNISNPASPVYLGSGSTDGGYAGQGSLYVQGRYAYIIANDGNYLDVMDVSNPAAPVKVGSSTTNISGPTRVIVAGRYAYVTSANNQKILVFDVSNPYKPTLIAQNSDTNSGGPTDIAISGRYAYVINNNTNGTLTVYDLGGEYDQQLQTGTLETATLQVDGASQFSSDVNMQGALTIGSNLQAGGNLGLGGGAQIQGSTIMNGGNNQLSIPTISTVTPTLGAATTWGYKVTAINASGGETPANSQTTTAAGAATLDATHFNTISWGAVSGATAYKIYRTTAGTSPNTTGLIGTSTTTSFVDNGIFANGATAPVINTTGQLTVQGAAVFANATNSTTAFQVQNAAGTSLLTVDTTNSSVKIGSGGISTIPLTVDNATTGINLLQVKDLNTNFGSAITGGAFIGRNSYFGEEFNNFHKNNGAADWPMGRGDMGNQNTAAATAGGGELTYDVTLTGTGAGSAASAADTLNGIEQLAATSAATSTSVAEEYPAGDNVANNAQKNWQIGSLPVMVFKFKPSVAASGRSFFLGLTDVDTPAISTAAEHGVYFTNCSTGAATPTCDGTLRGMVNNAGTVTTVSCGTVSTTQYTYGRIEVRNSAEIHFYADLDTSNGVVETECGTGITTNIPTSTTPMTLFVKAAESNAVAESTTLNIDYMRIWQDDNLLVESPDQGQTATAPDGSPIITPAPITPDPNSPDPNTAGSFFNFLGASSEDMVVNGDLFVHGTIFADKIKANEIEGLNIYTDQLASLQQRLNQVNSQTINPNAGTTSTNIIQTATTTINLNDGLTVGGDANFHGNAFFYKLVTFTEKTVFNNDISFAGHITTAGDTPTINTLEGAGVTAAPADNPTAALAKSTLEGNDNSGRITVDVGANAAAGNLVKIDFKKSFTKAPQVFLTPSNTASAQAHYYISSSSDGFTIVVNDTPLSGTSYTFNYLIIQ
jgi:hypothetical protein